MVTSLLRTPLLGRAIDCRNRSRRFAQPRAALPPRRLALRAISPPKDTGNGTHVAPTPWVRLRDVSGACHLHSRWVQCGTIILPARPVVSAVSPTLTAFGRSLAAASRAEGNLARDQALIRSRSKSSSGGVVTTVGNCIITTHGESFNINS